MNSSRVLLISALLIGFILWNANFYYKLICVPQDFLLCELLLLCIVGGVWLEMTFRNVEYQKVKLDTSKISEYSDILASCPDIPVPNATSRAICANYCTNHETCSVFTFNESGCTLHTFIVATPPSLAPVTTFDVFYYVRKHHDPGSWIDAARFSPFGLFFVNTANSGRKLMGEGMACPLTAHCTSDQYVTYEFEQFALTNVKRVIMHACPYTLEGDWKMIEIRGDGASCNSEQMTNYTYWYSAYEPLVCDLMEDIRFVTLEMTDPDTTLCVCLLEVYI